MRQVALLLLLSVSTFARSLDEKDEVTPVTVAKAIESQKVVEEECQTEGCRETVGGSACGAVLRCAASLLLQSMDLKADPCQDFFHFCCGQFVKSKEIPDDRVYVSVVSQMDVQIMERVRSLLEEPTTSTEPTGFAHAKALYCACMNTTLLEERGITPARDIVTRLGGWPVLEGADWNESSFDWIQMSYKLSQEGILADFMFSVMVSYDITNTSRHGIVVNMAKLVIDPKGLAPDMVAEKVRGYHSLSTDVAVMFGANRTTALKDMMDVINFELALGNITKSREARRDIMSWLNPMNISTLNENYPFIPWTEYLNAMLMDPDEDGISEEEVVVVYDTEYMAQLHSVISRTPKRTVANYMVWRAVMSQLQYLNTEASRRLQEFENGIKEQQRWERCVQEVQNRLTYATGSMYVRRFFPQEARKIANEIVQNIRQEMYDLLESVDWMDETTRQAAMMKAQNMHYGVGYADEFLQDESLAEFYSELEVRKDRYLESVLEINKLISFINSRQLHVPVNKRSWSGRIDVVNAYYNFAGNSLFIPAGILQGAFFGQDRPQYMNYGAIGSAIGHEVTHAFDDRGRLFNMDGELIDWWKEETRRSFTDKVRCIIEQYSNYTDKQVNEKLNGIITQGENIADNAGVKLAYRAYLQYESRSGRELRLPLPAPPLAFSAQPLNSRQLFWVAFATPWCAKYRSKDLRITLKTSPHLPGQYRVNGALSNQEEFAKDFSCPKGSPMNPIKRCHLW